MGIKIVRRCCAGILLGLPGAMPWAQDLPPPAERVQRQADNPLRWIIEAGKLKSRSKLAAEPEAAARASGDKPAPRSTAAKAPVRAKEAVAASSPAADAGTRLAGLDEGPSPPPPPTALELVSDGEMVLPDAIYDQLRADAEVEIQFTVNADGSVSDASVRASNNPNVDAVALAGVRGWRFKPIAQAQVHSVQLVFHPRQ